MADSEKWQWQEPGTAWKGVGLYHLIMTVTNRQPVLGRLPSPDDDPARASVVRTPLGDALVDCLLTIPQRRPEVQVLHFCLMPDHLHAVVYVRRPMPKGIGTLARGFWQAAKQLGRASSAAASLPPSAASSSFCPSPPAASSSFITPNGIRGNLQEASRRLQALSTTLREQMGDNAYYRLAPIFGEIPFIRCMGRSSQLPNTIRYLDMNPQRLATKRLKPGLFRVQRDITIGDRNYDGVGNVALLMRGRFATVHVRRTMVEHAQHGNAEPLRHYKNTCVLQARNGTVMVSPFISPDEKQVMQVLLRERLPFILLTDNGFREYYKPSDALFDACAEGRLLILSPWQHDDGKKHISRADCVALNGMAEALCSSLHTAEEASDAEESEQQTNKHSNP